MYYARSGTYAVLYGKGKVLGVLFCVASGEGGSWCHIVYYVMREGRNVLYYVLHRER